MSLLGKDSSKSNLTMQSNDNKHSKGKNKSSTNKTSNAEHSDNKCKGTPLPELPALEGYLSYMMKEITPELAAHAKLNLNETEESRREGLRKMREILKADPDLKFTDTDDFLLIFLRSRKFDPKRSSDFFKTGLSYIESYRHLLDRKDPEVIRSIIGSKMVGFMPYRDAKGRAIIYARADKWDWTTIPAGDAIFGGVVAVQSAAHNPVNQVSGFVVVLDLKDLKIQQVLAMTRWLIFGTITLQRACPCFMKAFHVINVPPIYKIGWKLVKPLLSEKIRKRFIFHKSDDLSTLYEYIPQEILPKELGGPYPFTNDYWAQDIDLIENLYYSYLDNNYFISKRKGKTTGRKNSISNIPKDI
ncbi:hypothetical protein JTE90_029046 [Oedothorax gibbosus]|uniref:CRAL-TRIO domain-containing protein n=1 Tax=Oedothorax gibbosus TaxID=931172 RepID=A0AAV6UWF2_9ARAC|nr:hypothetical protein JTE90_029046 [Oedothorax gibbosus]